MAETCIITPELLSTPEAAALCGVSRRHFLTMASSGRLGPRPVRLGARSVRWHRGELVEWCAAGCPGRLQWELKRDTGLQARRA